MDKKIKLDTLNMAFDVLLRSSRLYFILLLFLSAVSGLPSVINLRIWEKIINEIASGLKSGLNEKLVVILLLAHFAIYMLGIICNKSIGYINDIYTLKIEKKISEDIIELSKGLSLIKIEDSEIQNHMGKIGDNTTSKVSNMIDIFVDMVKNMVVFVGMLKIILGFNMCLIALIVLSLIPIFTLNKKAVEKYYKMYDESYESLRLAEYLKKISYSYQGNRDLKLYSAFDFILKKLDIVYNNILKKKKEANKANISLTSVGDIFESIATYSTKALIIFEGVAKKQTIGRITMVFVAVESLQNCLVNFISALLNIYDSLLYLDSYQYLQRENDKLKITAEYSKNNYRLNNISDIDFIDVWFKYPQSNDYVLKGINMHFERGKTYEVIGLNGSGKTTLVKLILGLYPPSKGKILINGKDISLYNLEEYLSLIVANFQDFIKLPLTIGENISMASYEGNVKSKLERASILGNSYDFINKKERKFNEIVMLGWESSEDLSSGQWQKINLSRTFYQDDTSQVRIFDEPTSNLDLLAESTIFNNIKLNSKNFLNIIITHRFFPFQSIDKIFIIEDGVITNQGNHEFLLKNSSLYKELFNMYKSYQK